MKVVKRDGREEDYDGVKVIKAASAALIAAGYGEKSYPLACAVGEKVYGTLEKSEPPQEKVAVCDIHRIVEDSLMDLDLKNAARAYIEYRKTRDNVRESKGKLLADITGFLEQTADEFTKENANKPSGVVSSHRDLLAGILSKHVSLTQILPEELAEWHTNGYGHVHE